MTKFKTVVYNNWCLWQGHECNAGKSPNQKKSFWEYKIRNTIKRDRRNYSELSNPE